MFAGSTEKPTTTTSGAGGGAGAAAPPKPAVAAAAVRAKSDGEEEVVEFIDFDSTTTASKERNYECTFTASRPTVMYTTTNPTPACPSFSQTWITQQTFNYMHVSTVHTHTARFPIPDMVCTGGVDRKEAFARVAVAMFGYMTDLDTVSIDPSCNRSMKCKGNATPPPSREPRSGYKLSMTLPTGHDAMSLLYSFLDEMLYTFCSDDFVAKEVAIVAVDWDAWTLTASAKGEKFDLKKHPQVMYGRAHTSSVHCLSLTNNAATTKHRALRSRQSHTLQCKYMPQRNQRMACIMCM